MPLDLLVGDPSAVVEPRCPSCGSGPWARSRARREGPETRALRATRPARSAGSSTTWRGASSACQRRPEHPRPEAAGVRGSRCGSARPARSLAADRSEHVAGTVKVLDHVVHADAVDAAVWNARSSSSPTRKARWPFARHVDEHVLGEVRPDSVEAPRPGVVEERRSAAAIVEERRARVLRRVELLEPPWRAGGAPGSRLQRTGRMERRRAAARAAWPREPRLGTWLEPPGRARSP